MKQKIDWKKVVKNNNLKMDILNVVLGAIVIVLLVLVIIMPTNIYGMMGLTIVAGVMNLMNGFRNMEGRSKNRKAFYKIIGFILLAYGFYLIKAKFIM